MSVICSEGLSLTQRQCTGRDAPPTHYSFKILSFSLLSKASIEKYSSDKFEVGGYKWKLTIYPTGKKKRNGHDHMNKKGNWHDHISIFLELVDTSSLPAGWEVKVIFNLFVFDKFQDKYFGLPDATVTRFHEMKTEWGIPNFISLQTFTDPSKGYLVDDTCVFGADIFVLKQTRKAEWLSMIEDAIACNHTWKIKSFPSLTMERYESEAFLVGDYKWRIRLYPRGNGDGKGNSISVFLSLDDSTLPPDTKLFVKYSLRIMNQINAEHFEIKDDDNHFDRSCLVWGRQKFMSLAKLNDPKKGFLEDDTCIIEAQVTLLGIVGTVS